MNLSKSKYGFSSIFIGMIALSIAIFSFWADPFLPADKAEPTIEEKILSFKQTAIDKLKGKPSNKQAFTLDKLIAIAIPTLSILGILLALFSYIKKEPTRIAVSGGVIATSAIIFQVIAAYTLLLFVLLALIAIAASLTST